MFVMYSADNLNLSLELTLSLATSKFQLLYSNLFAIRQQSSVNVTKTTLSKEISIRKSICCPHQLVIRKCALREAKNSAR
uniref:Uncharacterized protein n=2 Tax=Arundo donax TaxID=35708 RepID=A0A0A9DDT8_ARUDO